jgi:hypothetical protein
MHAFWDTFWLAVITMLVFAWIKISEDSGFSVYAHH